MYSQLALSFYDGKLLRLPQKGPTKKFGIHGTEKFDPDNDTAGIMFSSGTTGFPKAVQLTHSNLVCQLHLTG
jgi:long-subunit acyl-CoA synthetase (AMP-forming)